MRIYLTQLDNLLRLEQRIDGSSETIILMIQPGNDVRDNINGVQGLAGSSHLISETLDLI
jgi:hypothetical protein